MSVWSGWQAALIAKANIPDSIFNQDFLNEWHSNAASNCHFNPVDISHKTTGSTNCKGIGGGHTAQNYTTHAHSASAFASQLHSGSYPSLAAALKSGSPYTLGDKNGVVSDVAKWGSENFSFALSESFKPPGSGGGGGGGSPNAPSIHRGWTDLRKTVNSTVPDSVRYSDKLGRAALRDLQRARKVKL